MRKIKLTQGKYAIVDNEDYEWLNQYKWYVCFDGYNWYAATGHKVKTMHRIILKLGYKDGKAVDHINGNGLDNRRCNLRIVTHQQNHFNRKNVKGYYWHKKTNKWMAYIWFNGKQKNLGYFNNEKDAHQAYLKAKKKYHKIIEETK